MRLFVAMDVSDDTRAQLRRIRDALQQRLASARRPPRVTWVADSAAHGTLRFIGEVADDVGDQVQRALAASFASPAIESEWTELRTFPGGRRPRVIWLGPSRGQEELLALAAAINTRLEPVVGPDEERKFRAHLTIGRIRDTEARFNWKKALEDLAPGSSRTLIDHVTLYQSRLSPKGPTYTALSATPLRKGPQMAAD